MVQYTITEDLILLFNLTKMMLKSVSTTHSLYSDCTITNNFPCIMYEHFKG